MLQWNSTASAVLVVAILTTLASLAGVLEPLNFAW
jgi:hypothetical protein